MAWYRIKLSAEEQTIVNEERVSHPNVRIRSRMLALWLLHCRVTRERTAEIVEVGRATVQRWVAAYREGGLDGLRRWEAKGSESDLAAFRDQIREMFAQQPARTVAEAAERIYQLTGLRRGLTQTRKFLKGLGLKWQRIRAIPVPPKKTWRNMSRPKPNFMTAS